MPHRPLLLGLLALATLFVQPFAPAAVQAQVAPAQPSTDLFAYFPQTGHNIGGRVKQFFDAHGGVDTFGLPLTEVFGEDGTAVQYFEHARFEVHNEAPADSRIQLTRLGAHYAEGRQEPAFQWLAASPSPDRTFVPQSGHTLGGAFGWFWQSHGGVDAFGYPVSEELNEKVNPNVDQTYLVQYFERARLEYHLENVGNEIVVSSLGRQMLNERSDALAATPPAQQLVLLGQATTGYRTSATERVQNIGQSAAMFDGVVVQPGQEYSFLNSGDFNENANFVEGYAIVGGRLEKVIGGGLCQVSTTMFRAVSNAGLDVTRRQGHTYVVYFYENILGFDATVFSPSLDFRWRNDTSGPVYSPPQPISMPQLLHFRFGTSDGRKVSYEGPFVKNVVKPSVPVWHYDPSLPAGVTTQLVHGRSGMDVSYIRTVTMPDGSTKHYDNYRTHYDPWEDFFSYGPGVKR